ncbi:MAG: HlyD family efflux transporter periplasmic adaptor subunit [Pararhizobium sp.]
MAKSDSKNRLAGVRVFSFSVAGVLGLLLVSTTMPPILGGSSERALIDAPAELVTSPIEGVVTDLTATQGGTFAKGEKIAVVRNNDVERSKLIQLELSASKIDNDISNGVRSIANLKDVIAHLNADIDRQRQALIGQYQEEIDGSQADLDKKKAQAAIAKRLLDIDQTLQKKGVRGGGVLQTKKAYAAAKSAAETAKSSLDSAKQRLAASRKGVYLGPNADPINALLQELRSNQDKLDERKVELASLKDQKASVDAIRDTEKQRVAQMSHRIITMPASGELLNLSVNEGSAVQDGDAIARSVDCADTFVVAIFSEHKASSLSTGAPVTVRAAGWDRPVKGTVEKLVPRATATQNNNYAVPFPPTERRELYAYIKLPEQSRTVGKGTCAIGKWVTVSLDNSPIPSTDDLARMASEAGAKLYAGAAKAGTQLYAGASDLIAGLAGTVPAFAQSAADKARAEAGLVFDGSETSTRHHAATTASDDRRPRFVFGRDQASRSAGFTRPVMD